MRLLQTLGTVSLLSRTFGLSVGGFSSGSVASTTPVSHKARGKATEVERRQMSWRIQAAFEGTTFFDNFHFYNKEDLNRGEVNYVDALTAFSKGLAFWTKDGIPGIQVEHWQRTSVGQKRDSVRLSSKLAYNKGLFIVDLALLPWGCGVWPAVWTLGAGGNWPYEGEIDIVEGVHSVNANQMTVHTRPGCTLGPDTSGYTGSKMSDNCDSTNGGTGCSIKSNWNGSYGQNFNEYGGGVFATLWDDNGIRMWNWARRDVPNDINSRAPTPGSWGPPVAAWDRSTCDPSQYMKPQAIILNINLCGDWAGATYSQFGCPGTCAEHITDPANLNNTVMQINSIIVYQQGEVQAVHAHSALEGAGGPVAAKSSSWQTQPSLVAILCFLLAVIWVAAD